MKKLFIFLTFLLIANFAFAENAITFAVIGDQTESNNLSQSYKVLQHAVTQLNNKSLSVVLHIGDLIESTQDADTIKKNYTDAINILNQLHAPWYLTAGDHDVNPITFKQNSQDRSREKLFQILYSAQNPKVSSKLYYSFNINDYHFISLYTEEQLDADPRWGNIFLAHISDEQFNWLKQDLENNKNSAGIILFMHQPLWYNAAYWQKVHALLKQYKVLAVIAGHFHYSQDDGILDGIHYFVAGATGANIKEASANAGGIQQIAIVNIDPNQMTIKLEPIDDSVPIKLPTRENMDKIQALDQMLSGFYNFAQVNPLYIKNNKLVNSCSSDTNATIKLISLGNPLSETVNLTIDDLSDDKINLQSAHFASDVCEKATETACILKASARIILANNSSIEINNKDSPTFWEGVVILNNTKTQKNLINDYLKLKINFIFINNGEEFYIAKTFQTPIKQCT